MIDTKTNVIIDADHIPYVFLHGIKREDSEGNFIKENGKYVYDEKPFEQACSEVDKYIKDILDVCNAKQYIGFIGGGSNARKEVNPEYKANRVSAKPNNYDKMVEYLITNYHIIKLDEEHETDDYVASYATNISDTIIVSPDKDLKRIPCKLFIPKDFQVIDVPVESANYNFWFSMIEGDRVDGVKGLEGKGVKFAETVLGTFDVFSPKTNAELASIVFREYISQYGETLGITKFNLNYNSLKTKTYLKIKYPLYEYKNI